MSSYISHEIECWSYRCLYVFYYVLSHFFETIRISDKTQQIKTIFFSVLQGVQKYEIEKITPLKFEVKILNVIIVDLPTNQQKRVLQPRLITWIINAYLTCNYMTNIFKRSMGNIAHLKKMLSSHCGKGRGHSFEES